MRSLRARWLASRARLAGPLRTVGVPLVVVALGALGAAGVLGGGIEEERYDTWQTVLRPAGEDLAVRSTITFDQDFGSNRRHGPELHVDNDLGRPTEVTAHSPDAPDQVHVTDLGTTTRIRVGDPDRTVTGRHRYTVSFTYPRGLQGGDLLAIDVVATDDYERDAVEVVVAGFDLVETRCFVGEVGSTDDRGCSLARAVDGTYRTRLARLPAGHGMTVQGRVTQRTPDVTVAPPALPPAPDDDRLTTGLALAGVAAVSAAVPYLWFRRRGRNRVAGDGSVAAAFGPDGDDAPTRLVTDAALEDLATTTFAPPEGLEPWQGNVLLRERFDGDTVVAYLSGLVASGGLVITDRDGAVRIGPGPAFGSIDPLVGHQYLRRLFGPDGDHPHRLAARYDVHFARAWRGIEQQLCRKVKTSGWWTSGNPAQQRGTPKVLWPVLFAVAMVLVTIVLPLAVPYGIPRLLRSWWVALPLAVGLPALAAFLAYRHLAPARSAEGSALAIQVASFRRFLAASEAQHVTWAWEREVVREYSAWAIALGVADAWRRALDEAGHPAALEATAPTLLVDDLRHRVTAASHIPSTTGASSSTSSSSSSSSSFSSSGGSVGGGGGGVSGGSW